MKQIRIPVLALLALAAGAPAVGQEPRQFQVVPTVGWMMYQEESALDASPFLGLDASYFLNRNLAVGLQAFASRPRSDGDQFPLVMMDFGDTTFVYSVSQNVSVMGAGAQAAYHLPMGAMDLYVNGGGGVYQLYLDPRRTQEVSRHSGPFASVGGGLSYAVSETVGVRFDARDLVFMDYDRDVLDVSAVAPYVRNNRIPDLVDAPPEAKDVVHNLRFSLGFSFIPGADR